MSLRERKKRQTRDSISHVATRLFLERGYDRVTIAEVAQAAGVAKMTVTNHFPRKEDLVLDLHEEIVAGPARAVAARAEGESALHALRRAYFEALEARDAALGFSGQDFVEMIDGSPALRARLREIHEHLEDALAEALGDDITARATAAHLAATLRLLFREAFRRTLDGEDHDTIAAALSESAKIAFDLIEPALGGH